jgi:outer membrane protein W
MKKITFLVALSAIILNSSKSFAQAAQQGNITVNAMYGSPSIPTLIIRGLFSEGLERFNYLGPAGLSFEYFLSDNVSIALEGTYSTLIMEAKDEYTYNLSSQRIRIYPKINFHFKTSDKVDPYFSIGGGFKNSNIKYSSTDPNDVNTQDTFKGFIPFSFRTAIGTRYYFNDNIGLSGEFGFGGGALFMGGIIFKLN